MSDLKKKLAEATLQRRVVSIYTRGDLVAKFETIEERLQVIDETPQGGPPRLAGPEQTTAGGSDRVALAEELEEIRAEIRESAIEFTLEAFPSKDWRALKAEHPVGPKADRNDVAFGADVTAFFNAAVRKSIVDPVPDDEDWEAITSLPDAEWQKLVDTTYALNEDPVSVPFSSRGFGILSMRSDESESRETSD